MNFPANPQDGDTYNKYIYNSAIGVWLGGPQAVATEFYVDSGLDLKIDLTEKGQVLGVASLDGSGSVPISQLSSIVDNAPSSLNTLGKVAGMFNFQTTEDWALDTTVLPEGSVNVEGVTAGGFKVKIGNGTETWQQLEYVVFESDMSFYVSEELSTFEQDINQSLSTKADTSDVTLWLADKLDIADAQSTYALIDSPTFSGTVNLPSTTQIGGITSNEIASLAGISTSETIQSQIDNLHDDVDTKAPIESPTFTGTVSGITSTMVGLGNVDNTSDLDKPVSTATQSALDDKANLSGATFTGAVTLPGDPTQALHASTKAYVDNVSSGILAKPSVIAATTANLNSTYDNGSSGVGAKLTSTTNVAFPLIDGVSVTTINGQRGVLVKNQTNSFENGRYNLTTQGDENTPWVLTRCGLCDQANEIPGAYVFVTDGSVNGQSGWVQHVDDPGTFTVGTDDIDVFQFAGAGSITAGTNIEVSGNEVSVVDSPVFAEVVDVSAAGVEFADGTQTKVGVPSQTSFVYKTASYTIDSLDLADNIIEVDSTSATTVTIPLDSSVNYPVGTSIDILQTNTGQVTIAATGGVTMNGTPGFKLRTRWSSATILKRAANSWIVYGDLTA